MFLALSVGLWWRVWTGHPTTTATCGCGDPAFLLWFLEWPAYALTHGKDLLHSAALFHPTGVDLLSNTSVLAIGLPLVPVTLLFGPVATLNVAATALPVLSGLAMLWLLRRWVRWAPAAFAGALLYAFSPMVLTSLVQAHLMTAALAPFPVVLGWSEDLLLRHRHRPVVAGAVLAGSCGIEYFVSTELLAMLAIVGALALAVLAGYGLVVDRHGLLDHLRRAAPGLVVAGAGTVALLAYPTWYALAGPAHLAGPVWPDLPARGGTRLATLVVPSPRGGDGGLLGLGGYLGAVLPGAPYVGWGLVAVPAAALGWWWRDRRLWFLAAVAAGTIALSLGVRPGWWVPWQLVGRLPLADSIVEQRFVVFSLLALCAMWALALDHARALGGKGRRAEVRRRWAWRALPAGTVTGAVAAVLVPLAVPLSGDLPFAVRSVQVPAWVADAARHPVAGRVIFAYPAAFSGVETAMGWQAMAKMAYVQAGGGGPEGVPARAGPEAAGMTVLTQLSFPLVPPPVGSARQLAAVRRALAGWRVTTVVVPAEHGSSPIVEGRDPWYAAAFFTAALGARPRIAHRAWVWTTAHQGRAVVVPSTTMAACAAGAQRRGALRAVAPCVLGATGGREATSG